MGEGLDVALMRSAVRLGRIEWQRHALERMVERAIARVEVLQILLEGERIEDYPEDWPLPSALFLGWSHERPLHAVVAFNSDRNTVAIIAVYEPTLEHFERDFRTRRKL